MELEKYSEVFKALSHPLRLKIVCGLMKKGKCNVNTMVARLGESQSLISQHINILKSHNIIKGYREGNIIWYKLENEIVKKIFENIEIELCQESK